MNFLFYILIAIVSGIFAGMGMGGGTFLIPLLTLFMFVPQNVAQCINLLVFIPMAVINIFIYSKQKMIDFKHWWIVSIPACAVSLIGALVAINLSGKILKIIFGCFICLIGLIQIVALVVRFWVDKTKNVKNRAK